MSSITCSSSANEGKFQKTKWHHLKLFKTTHKPLKSIRVPSLQRLNQNKSRLDLLWLANAWHVVNRLNTPHHWTFIYSFGYIHIHIDISIYLNSTIIFVLMRAHSPGCTQLNTCIYVTHIYKVAQKKNPLITNRTKSYRAFPPFQKSMSFCPWSMQRAWENWVGHSNYHLTKVVQIFLSSPF